MAEEIEVLGGIHVIPVGVAPNGKMFPIPVSNDGTELNTAGGSGGGGATTIADGADVAEGATTDAAVAAGAAGTLSAKLRRVTQGLEDLKTLVVLAAGSNNIGDVDVASLPALPAGTNNIGDVDVLTLPADPLGTNADAAITTNATGSISGKLRGLVAILADVWVDAANRLRVQSESQGVSVDVNTAITADVDAAVAAATGLRLMGYSVRESAASAAVAAVSIKHGTTGAGGTYIARINLAADESERMWFGPDGIDVAASGISIDWEAGTVDVDLWHKTVT